jgi:hypothetical protein
MDISRDHVLRSRAGKLGASGASTIADVDRILNQASSATAPSGLIIHFHGGLVDAPSAAQIADRLAPLYQAAGTYPIFFVWESGIIEALRNNLGDIKDDSVFRELVKKVAEWALKQIGTDVLKSAGGALVDKDKLRKDFDDWFDGRSNEPPVSTDSPPPQVKTKGVVPDEDDLAENINAELDNDERFQEVIAGLYVASKRGDHALTKGGMPPAVDVSVLVDEKALKELFPGRTVDSTKGLLTWITIARFVAKIVVSVVKRHLSDRDHGTYITIVEEVLRAAYLDRVGTVVWRAMKKDTADAFAEDANCVGTAVLACMAKLAAQGNVLPRITLVGHSTGAIYINHLIEQAAKVLPDTAFDIVLLAPASRFEDFARILAERPTSIRNFRMFAMTDTNESNDQLVPIIYPRSLLYFVSGVLEGDADMPIMGMHRFFALNEQFGEAAFPAVASVRKWLGEGRGRSVWSVAQGANGLSSRSLKHGDFDNDEFTVASVCWILQSGY